MMKKRRLLVALILGICTLGVLAYRLGAFARVRTPAAHRLAPKDTGPARYHALGLPAPDDPIATIEDEKIPAKDFYRMLMQSYGQEILRLQIQDIVVQQEIERRRIKIPETEVKKKTIEFIRALKAEPTPRVTFESLLAERKMTPQQFAEELRKQIAIEVMVRQDRRIPDSSAVKDEQVTQWINELVAKAKIRGQRQGLRPGIVAVVNGEEILEADILKEISDRASRSDLERLLERVVDDRIGDRLMRERNITIAEADVNAATKDLERKLRARPGLASVTLESYLKASDKSLADIQQHFRRELALRKIVAMEIPESQLRTAFQENMDRYNGKLVHAQHILAAAVDFGTMKPKDPRAFERAKAKIERIASELRRGVSFEDMARRESDDVGTAKKGGDLGFIRRAGDVCEEVAATAFSLKPGAISQPVRSPYGFHLIRVLEVKPGKPVRFEDVRHDVLADIVERTWQDWFLNYKRRLRITRNLGNMGRATGPATPTP